MLQNPSDDKSALVRVIGLVPSGNKPIPEPTLIQISSIQVSVHHEKITNIHFTKQNKPIY